MGRNRALRCTTAGSYAYKDALAPLHRSAAELVLGHIDSDSIPDIATDALLAGLDTPYLCEAAGSTNGGRREPEFLFERALNELAIEMPSRSEAMDVLLFDCLVEMANGARDRVETAHWIWRNVYGQIEPEGDLRIFVGLASEHDDHPTEHQLLADAIGEAANEILGRGFLRHWLCLEARIGMLPVRKTNLEGGTPIDLTSLDVPPALGQRLTSWAYEFDTAQQRPGRGPSGFGSVSAAEDFVARGENLRAALQNHLGSAWHVEYMPTARAFPK